MSADKLAQALRLAIEAMDWLPTSDETKRLWMRQQEAVIKLEEALAAHKAAPQQEPVAWVDERAIAWLEGRSKSASITTQLQAHKSAERPMPLYAAPQEPDKLDAERWRETLMRVGATRTEWVGGGHMFMVNLKPPSNVMQGSVAQHFTAAIDAARKAQP